MRSWLDRALRFARTDKRQTTILQQPRFKLERFLDAKNRSPLSELLPEYMLPSVVFAKPKPSDKVLLSRLRLRAHNRHARHGRLLSEAPAPVYPGIGRFFSVQLHNVNSKNADGKSPGFAVGFATADGKSGVEIGFDNNSIRLFAPKLSKTVTDPLLYCAEQGPATGPPTVGGDVGGVVSLVLTPTFQLRFFVDGALRCSLDLPLLLHYEVGSSQGSAASEQDDSLDSSRKGKGSGAGAKGGKKKPQKGNKLPPSKPAPKPLDMLFML